MDQKTDTDCVCNTDERNEISEFENFVKWRNENMNYTSNKCSDIQKASEYESPFVHDELRRVPKCLVHYTRKMCKCNQVCIGESFIDNGFDTKCLRYDLTNLYLDDRYKDCRFLNKKVDKGKLIPNNQDYDTINTANFINNELKDLCDYKVDMDRLFCHIYDLRDGCNNIKSCMKFLLKPLETRECENDEYTLSIENIEGILNFNFNEINHDVEHAGLEEDEQIEKVFREAIYGRTKRSIPEGISKQISFKSSSLDIREREDVIPMLSVSIISILLIGLLCYLKYKYSNVNKTLFGTLVTCALSMCGLSIYSSWNSIE